MTKFFHTLRKRCSVTGPLASSFNMEKLLTTAAGTTEKGKAGANAQRPTTGVVTFFSKRRCLLRICLILLEDAL